ncbi:MAG TPA: MarR family winged helix-turn-helix transcriptional regulator [Saprospiraceae bacterium]|nr:MarR family winged helix-turn-helix transcriptional regulator [Saprospiraceae bacterium]HMQ84283.1 MarR family winged helix-turn-helix transcriptional regulator [Saprospiraceae bacterium]
MEKAIQLLLAFQEFSQSHHSEDLSLFGEWLKQRSGQEADYLTDEPSVNEAGLDIMASYLIGKLSSYVETWVKISYQDLPILSLGDFGIIKTVESLGNPTKKEIAAQSIMERTTCMESIKRMIRLGLLEEYTDQVDKRLKRVMLTSEGQHLTALLNKKMMSLGILLMGNLNEVEKKSLVVILKKLNDFHDNLYQKRDDLNIAALYQL